MLCNASVSKPSNLDYKTALQELVQQKKGQILTYSLAGESGPDHNKEFAVEVTVNGKVVGNVEAREHIRPVAEWCAEEIDKKLSKKLGGK